MEAQADGKARCCCERFVRPSRDLARQAYPTAPLPQTTAAAAFTHPWTLPPRQPTTQPCQNVRIALLPSARPTNAGPRNPPRSAPTCVKKDATRSASARVRTLEKTERALPSARPPTPCAAWWWAASAGVLRVNTRGLGLRRVAQGPAAHALRGMVVGGKCVCIKG